MSFSEKINANPTVYTTSVAQHSYTLYDLNDDYDDGEIESPLTGSKAQRGTEWADSTHLQRRDKIDSLEIFEMIRHLNDPEHPLTLEQLNVAQLTLVNVDDDNSTVDVHFTPTIPHCSMATLIGLCLRVKLLRALPPRFKVTVKITPGTHNSEEAVNKQLNDKERVAAALENGSLLDVVNRCITRTDKDLDADLLARAWLDGTAAVL